MKVTRNKVFETNSSSTHSLSIAGGEYKAEAFPIDNGICRVHPGEFGWDVCTQMLINVLKAETGCEVEFVPIPRTEWSFYEWGYIDHQSHFGGSDACGCAFESEGKLRDFIFNHESILMTDNDNR